MPYLLGGLVKAIFGPSGIIVNVSPQATMWRNFIVTTVVIGLALFLAAGTLDYWQAWIYLGTVLATGIPHVVYLNGHPVLLEGRTKVGPMAETRPAQKRIVTLMALPAIALFILPGFDCRYGWSEVPPVLVFTGDALLFLSMWMVYRVLRENAYGSATVEVTQGQQVISTGPYAIVRNPMYSSALVYFIGMSLALNSYWDLIPGLLTALGLVWRLFDEEEFLAENLPGYKAYCAKVRRHLIPGVF